MRFLTLLRIVFKNIYFEVPLRKAASDTNFAMAIAAEY